MRRIGILGGTFDPPHIAHLRIAEEAREQMQLDAVFFVPNKQPVHREPAVANAEDRYAMLILATADNPAFRVSRDELDRTTPSYSVETVRSFRNRYPH
ncbi:MAG: nicotinate-nicotinamide nucleotide adenylyltransferase, partial [Armatimonadota bacterium]